MTRLKTLIAGGVDVNVQDDKGKTPLSVATLHNKYDVAKVLLENGAVVTPHKVRQFSNANNNKLIFRGRLQRWARAIVCTSYAFCHVFLPGCSEINNSLNMLNPYRDVVSHISKFLNIAKVVSLTIYLMHTITLGRLLGMVMM